MLFVVLLSLTVSSSSIISLCEATKQYLLQLVSAVCKELQVKNMTLLKCNDLIWDDHNKKVC